MKPLKSSYRELNSIDPLLAAVVFGLIGVGMVALALPGGVAQGDAWWIFFVCGPASAMVQWSSRRKGDRISAPARPGSPHDAVKSRGE